MQSSTTRSLAQNSSTPNRSIYAQRAYDTFETARTLGSLSTGFGTARFRARGAVNRSDKVDIYKVSLLPGASISGGSTDYDIKGAPVRVSVFGEFQGQRVAAGSLVVELGKSTKGNSTDRVTNTKSSPIILYYQISRIRKDASYRATFNLFQ
jgi:hypothetical protein